MPESVLPQHGPRAGIYQEKALIAPGDPNLRAIALIAIEFPKGGVVDMSSASRILNIFRPFHQPQKVPVPVIKLITRQDLIAPIPIHVIKPNIHAIPRLVRILSPPQVQRLVVRPDREPRSLLVAIT